MSIELTSNIISQSKQSPLRREIPLFVNLEESSDKELLEIYQSGHDSQSNDAFEVIYKRYEPYLTRYIASKVKDDWERKTILSDIHLKIIGKLETFEWRDIPLQHWFSTIAKTTVKEHYAAKKRKIKYCQPDYIDCIEDYIEQKLNQLDNPTPLDIVIAKELQTEANELLFKAIKTLKNSNHRNIIRLIYLKGITNSSEIGLKLGLKPATVRQNHKRGLKNLLQYFAKQQQGDENG